MQLFALDEHKEIIDSLSADKGKTYFCPECAAPLHLRGGPIRQNHFYHLRSTRSCRQSKKSLEHLQVQLYLKRHLPGTVHLEHRFLQIERIADAFWPEQGLIFEVQCSPITGEEILSRNADYAKLGLSVVWILHEKRYGDFSYTCAEAALKYHPHYYTNLDREGNGFFYDQAFAYYHPLVRTSIYQKVQIDPAKPIWKKPRWGLPTFLKPRTQWRVSFEKDLMAIFHKSSATFFNPLKNTKSLFLSGFWKAFYKATLAHLQYACKKVWKHQLERSCR